jgi:hypothetical protein
MPVYWVGFVNAKAVFLTVDYEYESAEPLDADLASLKKALPATGYSFLKQHQVNDLVAHEYKSKKGWGTLIVVDKDFDIFTLMIGEAKYIEMALE